MIRTIKIKCPYCHEISELFLSMNPTVIVLNCPECWTPIMYDKHEIRILSAHEINKIASSPTSQSAINSFFDKITQKNIIVEESTACEKHASVIDEQQPEGLEPPDEIIFRRPVEFDRGMITADDLIDLQITLAACKDVQEFINEC